MVDKSSPSEIGDREEDFTGELADIPKLPIRQKWPTPSAAAMTLAAEAGGKDTAERIFGILQKAALENSD